MRDISSQPAGPGDFRQHQLRTVLEDSPVPVSVATLAEVLGVSISTIERHVAALRAKGVQVQSERGRSGGLYIVADEMPSFSAHPEIASTDFVGREAELKLLVDQARAIPSGRVPVVALAGESGIGKTYLLDRFAAICRATGFMVSRTDGYDRLTSPPFHIWIRVLQDLRAGPGSAVGNAESLETLLGDLKGIREPLGGASALNQFELFERVAHQLARSADSGLALLVDDLHFADASSIDLLEYIANSRDETRLVIVFTYEPGLVHRRSPVRRLLGRLVAHANYSRLALGPLSRVEINSLVGKVLPGPVSVQLSELVHRRSEGNPLFAREIIRELGDGGATITDPLLHAAEHRLPEGLRDAVSRRLGQCSEECVDLLGISAVVGRRFRLQELRSIAGNHNFTTLIDEAEQHAIISPDDHDDGYRFSHGLIRNALLQDLSLHDRIRINSLVGLRREQVYGKLAPQHATEIAHYMVTAASVVGIEKAMQYSVWAGKQYLSGFSFSEAEEHFRNAVNLKSERISEDLASRAQLGLGRALGATLRRERKYEAVSLLNELVDARLAAGDVKGATAAALADIIPVGTGVAQPTEISAMAGKVVGRVEQGSVEHGRLLVAQAHALAVERSLLAESQAAATRALEIAQVHGDDVLAVRARRNILAVKFYSGTLDDESDLHSLLRDSLRVGDIVSELRVRFYLANLLCTVADPRAYEEGEAFRERAERFGESGAIQQALGMAASLLARQGRFDDAISTAEANLARTGVSDWALSPLYAASDSTGRPYSSRDLRNAVLSGTNLPRSIRAQVATIFLMKDQDGHDAEFIDVATGLAREILDDASRTHPSHYFRLLAARFAGLVGIARRDHAQGEASYQVLAGRPEWTHMGDGVHQGRVLWRLAMFLGKTDEATAHLLSALESARRAGYRPQLAETLCDLASMELERNHPDVASASLAEARELAEALGMSGLMPRLVQLERLCEASIESKDRLPGG